MFICTINNKKFHGVIIDNADDSTSVIIHRCGEELHEELYVFVFERRCHHFALREEFVTQQRNTDVRERFDKYLSPDDLTKLRCVVVSAASSYSLEKMVLEPGPQFEEALRKARILLKEAGPEHPEIASAMRHILTNLHMVKTVHEAEERAEWALNFIHQFPFTEELEYEGERILN